MYIVLNKVFYTCGKLNIEKLKSLDNLSSLNLGEATLKNYWFSGTNESDYGYIEFNNISYKDIFNKNIGIENSIERLNLKIHITGVTSVEIFFKLEERVDLEFEKYPQEFIENYQEEFYAAIYDFNSKLSEKSYIEFSQNYKFSTLKLKSETQNIRKKGLSKIHYFTKNREIYDEIGDFYQQESIKSGSAKIELGRDIYEATIYKESTLWSSNSFDSYKIAQLLDIDTTILNETIIYKEAGELYTDLMYDIDFNENLIADTNTLMEMHKINTYFIQKIRFNEILYNEKVDYFVDTQRSIEKTDELMDIFEKSETNYLKICEVVQENEKSESGKIVQYILVFLTLFTVISVVQGIVDFVDVDFRKTHNISIGLVSKIELMIGMIALIIFGFIKIKRYIKSS
ncbi:hypothetical protein [Aliarcobacter cryaerophilus]|jgi:hypothetical protein|uniref:hypothetical protein n=1 Tax=Aliarcobacter cryaerophilus TaxID=28198 RepID=UPI0021B6081B|nr:hypothetical protein [Aliarcobacter cryaerophilus]MCT7529884.1 hypothetical protein [Aliarcobacter cryaerophilus]